ncbi:MAG: hypothetical protein WB392_04545 [Methanotrichaceae archaeon]
MSSKTDLLSNEEIRRRGIEALEHALGPVDTIRFLQSFSLSRGDYSMERAKVLNLERDEIVKGIEKRRELKKT